MYLGPIYNSSATPSLSKRIRYIDQYEVEARQTAIWNEEQKKNPLIYCTLGLCGESGEFADKVKKTIRGDKGGGVDDEGMRQNLLLELGDVLWYLTNSAVELGSSLEEVANMNIAKLRDRQARGVLKSSGDNR